MTTSGRRRGGVHSVGRKSRHANGTDRRMAISSNPARHQNATSHDGASRPRNERSSMAMAARQQSAFSDTTGAGQTTDSASSDTNAEEASRRLASIDIEPFSNHAEGVDLAVPSE